MQDLSNLVVYNDGELELKVSVDSETIWLTQKQIAEVFGVNIPAISKHIKNIYKDKRILVKILKAESLRRAADLH